MTTITKIVPQNVSSMFVDGRYYSVIDIFPESADVVYEMTSAGADSVTDDAVLFIVREGNNPLNDKTITINEFLSLVWNPETRCFTGNMEQFGGNVSLRFNREVEYV